MSADREQNRRRFLFEGTMEPGWLQPKRAAAYADVGERTMRRWLAAGLPHSRVGGVVLVKRAELDAWIRSHSSGLDLDQLAGEVLAGL